MPNPHENPTVEVFDSISSSLSSLVVVTCTEIKVFMRNKFNPQDNMSHGIL